MNEPNIVISGASVAGLTLAYWLRRNGYRPTIVERNNGLRRGGQALDVRGAGLLVTDRMGLGDRLVAARTGTTGMSFVDADGTELHRSTDATLTGGEIGSEDVEVLRDDLVDLLADGLLDELPVRYGDTITSFAEHDDGVTVRFSDGTIETFDLVLGADGVHSTVRRLAFGPEHLFRRHLDTYLAVFTMDNFLALDHWQVFHRDERTNTMVGVYSARNNREVRAMLGFEAEWIDHDHSDVEQQMRILDDRFAGAGWETPRLLKAMREAPDFHFDAAAQIRMDRWSAGRVALVGDAGYCASFLSGQGTTVAIVGAYVLANELARAGRDHRRAFDAYERRMRPFVRANQDSALVTARTREPTDPETMARISSAISLDPYR